MVNTCIILTVQLLRTDSGHTISVAPCSSSDEDLLLLLPLGPLLSLLPADSHGSTVTLRLSSSMFTHGGGVLGLAASFCSLHFSFFTDLL